MQDCDRAPKPGKNSIFSYKMGWGLIGSGSKRLRFESRNTPPPKNNFGYGHVNGVTLLPLTLMELRNISTFR